MLLIEQGFVAHRAEQKLYIPILAEEKDSILHGDAESAIATAALVLARTVLIMNQLTSSGNEFPRHEDGVIIATAGSAVGLELITLAWPRYQLETFAARDVRGVVDSERACVPHLLQDLSAVAVRDFEERKTTIMLRMVARGLLKEAGVTVAEAKGEELAGDVGGFLARVTSRAVATATERADTRTWSTLPGELSVVRSALPAGPHVLEVSYVGLNGTERVETIQVDIGPGQLTIASVHLVGSEPGGTQRFARARRGVVYQVPKQPTQPSRRRYGKPQITGEWERIVADRLSLRKNDTGPMSPRYQAHGEITDDLPSDPAVEVQSYAAAIARVHEARHGGIEIDVTDVKRIEDLSDTETDTGRRAPPAGYARFPDLCRILRGVLNRRLMRLQAGRGKTSFGSHACCFGGKTRPFPGAVP